MESVRSWTLLVVTVLGVVGGTYCAWDFLSENDTPTNVLRNMALIGGGFYAAVFASWRIAIAERQDKRAREEHLAERFQDACQLLSNQEANQSYLRISGLHALRYLVRDSPEFAIEVSDAIIPFMLLKPIALGDKQDYRELTVGRMTLEFIQQKIESEKVYSAQVRQKLCDDIDVAIGQVATRMQERGLDPFNPPSN